LELGWDMIPVDVLEGRLHIIRYIRVSMKIEYVFGVPRESWKSRKKPRKRETGTLKS
jgi:hypothetical protein